MSHERGCMLLCRSFLVFQAGSRYFPQKLIWRSLQNLVPNDWLWSWHMPPAAEYVWAHNKTIPDVKPRTEEREREKETHHKRSQLVSSSTFMGMVPIGSQRIISNINIRIVSYTVCTPYTHNTLNTCPIHCILIYIDIITFRYRRQQAGPTG